MLTIVLFVHVLCFGLALMLTAGVGILLGRVAATGDVRVIAKVFSVARPLQITGGMLWVVTGALGGWLIKLAGFAPNAQWLIEAYGAYAVLMVVGFGVHAPWGGKVARLAAADAAAGDTVGAELSAALHAPVEKAGQLLTVLSLIALIWLMVVKPG